MAAYIKRLFGFGDSLVERRNPLTDEEISSNLHIFGHVKKQINKIFVDINGYVTDVSQLMTDKKKICPDVIVENELKSIYGYRSKVKRICEVLTRDQMNVVFVGSTISGKSAVINAMLGENVLPMGHTTNCFLQVEGSQTGDAYLVTKGSNEKQNVESVTHLAHALNNEKDLVHLYWPKDRCSLLRDYVALVDSPGVDCSPHMDDWNDAHCIDADVFVVVVHSQSFWSMVTVKNFFHKISTKLSKPNIFILYNHWDLSANEPAENMDKVRKQHMKRATDFLVKELKVCTPEEAVSRIFFISAKEVLRARVNDRNGQALNSGALAEGFSARYMEFEEFEHRIEECISKSAIKTKFFNHSQQGKHILEKIYKIMGTIENRRLELIHTKMFQKIELPQKLYFTERKNIYNIICQLQRKIHQVVDDVEYKVSTALNEEICRLSVLVDEFNLPFHPEALHFNVYKKELHNHVESGLVSNLRAKLSTALAMNIDQCQREIIDKMSTLLPEDKRNINVKKRGPFEVLHRLHSDNLCGDFHEQLTFKFSWGLSKLVTRISSLTNWTRNQSNILISPSHIPSTSAVDGSRSFDYSLAVKQNLFMILDRVVSPCASGRLIRRAILALSKFIQITVPWWLPVAAGVYYVVRNSYQLSSWIKKAIEREFKRQYVDHATSELRLIVHIISANCRQQVEQELYNNFVRLCQLVDESATNLNNEMKNLDQELNMLTKSTEIAKMLRNKADLLKVELIQFDDTFLS